MRIFLTGLLILLISLPFAASAQEEESKPETFTYATYFNCDTNNEGEADDFVKTKLAPHYDAATAAGEISSWGWMAHHTGGKWRRILYFQASSVVGLLDAQSAINKRTDAAMAEDDDDGLGESCSSHNDYIWQVVAGNGGDERGPASMSVYHICKMEREDDMDELVKKHYAPIYDKAIADGKLTSWGWQTHIVGGKFRKLQTMSAKDYPTLLAARGAILNELGDRDDLDEFDGICYSHEDYLWDIQIENN